MNAAFFSALFITHFLFASIEGEELIPAQNIDCEFTLTSTRSYCGGAAPDPGMLEELRTPVPESGIFYFYSITNKKLLKKQASANAKGKVIVSLSPGKWMVCKDGNVSKSSVSLFLKGSKNEQDIAWKSKTSLWNGFELKEKGEHQFALNFHHYCPWQLNPDLPPPPMSPPPRGDAPR